MKKETTLFLIGDVITCCWCKIPVYLVRETIEYADLANVSAIQGIPPFEDPVAGSDFVCPSCKRSGFWRKE